MRELVELLINKKKTISTMESCTGGGVSNAITNIEGASEVLKFSAVTYSNFGKIKMGVSKKVIDKYSVSQIGRRVKIEQESASGVTAIFYKETPDVEFIIMPTESIDIDHNDQVHTPIFIQDNMKQLFTISSRGKASNERIDELIWKHVCLAGGANITCVPLYFLDVNTRIKYKDEDYIVSKISLPVTYNGMMQLTLSKIIIHMFHV